MSVEIDIQSAVIEYDIQLYIQERLYKETRLSKEPPEIKEEITRNLIDKADGRSPNEDGWSVFTDRGVRFRWVYCQINALEKCLTPKDLRNTLRHCHLPWMRLTIELGGTSKPKATWMMPCAFANF